MVEGDHVPLSSSLGQWRRLLCLFQTKDFEEAVHGFLLPDCQFPAWLREIMHEKMEKTIRPANHFALTLDPAYAKEVNDKDKVEGRMFLTECVARMMMTEEERRSMFMAYEEILKNTLELGARFDALPDDKKREHPAFLYVPGKSAFEKLAHNLLLCRPTSAAIERMFSYYSNHHSRLRTRLSPETLSSLVRMRMEKREKERWKQSRLIARPSCHYEQWYHDEVLI